MNYTPYSSMRGVTKARTFARAITEIEHTRLPPQSGMVRTTRGTMLRRVLPSMRQGYSGPFACSFSGLRVTVGEGWVRAGDLAEWQFPAVETPDGYSAFSQDNYVDVPAADGDYIVHIGVEVDPYDRTFNSVFYPALDYATCPASAPYIKNFASTYDPHGSGLNIGTATRYAVGYRVPLCLVNVAGGVITSLSQRQFGDIALPVFWEYWDGTNDIGMVTWDNSKPIYYVAMLHGHWFGEFVRDAPGVQCIKRGMISAGANGTPFASEAWGG